MELHSSIKVWLSEHNNHITTQEFVACGLSKTMLTRYTNAGLLLRAGHGVYTTPETTADVFYKTALHSKHIVFSHESALYLHGLYTVSQFVPNQPRTVSAVPLRTLRMILNQSTIPFQTFSNWFRFLKG